MKKTFVIILLSLFLINSSYAKNILNFYGLDFVIPKKLKGKVIKFEDYGKFMGSDFQETENMDFLGFGTGEATIGKNSKSLIIGKKKLLNFFDGNGDFEKNMEKFISKECQSFTTENQCVKKFLRAASPSFLIFISEKFDSAGDEYSESDIIKEAMMNEFDVEDLSELEEFDIEDFGSVKFKTFDVFVDQKNNPILFLSFEVNTPFGQYDTNWYTFIYDDRLFLMISDCSLGNRCKSVRKEMNLIISKFINIDNSQKINTDNGKILIDAVGGLKKAYQIKRMYKFLLILL